MFNDELQRNKRQRNAIIAIIFAFILLIVTISVFATVLSPKNEASVINEIAGENELISDDELSRIKKSVYDYVKGTFGTDKGPVNLEIRWNTIQEENLGADGRRLTMLVDIDEYRQTFKVSVDKYFVFAGCPLPSESKYPDSFCIGNNGELDDSIRAVFGSKLPYTGQTDDGVQYELSRRTKQPDDHQLKLWVNTCPNDTVTIQKANQGIKDFITSLGAPLGLFEWTTITKNCTHGE